VFVCVVCCLLFVICFFNCTGEVRAYAIPGGSEEIMMDLGIRMAMKNPALRSRL
jgi:hypothetical protein